jgi:hypothetical protein
MNIYLDVQSPAVKEASGKLASAYGLAESWTGESAARLLESADSGAL